MRKIMIVDDSLIIRINLKKLFEKNGFEVVAEATNGREAVEKYIIFQPDIITMDITMPEMDGISALEKIREIDEQIPVVMISALGQELKILEAVNKGANHFIVKPFQE
ncbi:MAG: response regulator, partial [Acidaminococcaceae bacterium]